MAPTYDGALRRRGLAGNELGADAMPPKSFYDLAFGVSPGGARKDAHCIRGSIDEIKADLAYELSESINVHLLCRYGAELALHVYEQGERVNSIDLHPFITVSVDSYPDITFLGSNKPTVCGAGTDDRDKVKMTLSEEMFSGKLDNAIKVTVDRDGVDVPSLVGEFAGDRVASRSQPLWSVRLAGTPERGPGRSSLGHVNKL